MSAMNFAFGWQVGKVRKNHKFIAYPAAQLSNFLMRSFEELI
jgi:hypothetical protein